MEEDLLTITDFARLVGIPRKTVENAIIAGKIETVHIEGKRKKLHPETAAKEWLDSMTLGSGSKTKNYEKLRDYLTTLNGLPPAPPARKRGPKKAAKEGTILAAAQAHAENAGAELSDDADIAEAKRVEAIWKARKQELEYEEAKKKLIPADAVRKSMYEFGARVRQTVMALPDRIIDELMSKQRQEAYIFLKESLKETLREISENEQQD